MLGFSPIGTEPIGSIPAHYIVTASETAEGQANIKAYHEALGRFIEAFSEVETNVALTLRKYAHTSPEIAKVLFADVPLDGSMKLIQRTVAVSQPRQVVDGIDDIFKQLRDIKTMRNYILHYGAKNVAEGNATVSNALKAKGDPTEYPISPVLLEQMSKDLTRISFRLAYEHLERPRPRSPLGVNMLDQVLQSAWQYEHPTERR